MIGNRPKMNDEPLPDMEVKHHEIRHEVRYAFQERIDEGNAKVSFDYFYVKVYEYTEKAIKQALSKAGEDDKIIQSIITKLNF